MCSYPVGVETVGIAHMVQPSNNNNGSSDMDSLEDMLRKVNLHHFISLPAYRSGPRGSISSYTVYVAVYLQYKWGKQKATTCCACLDIFFKFLGTFKPYLPPLRRLSWWHKMKRPPWEFVYTCAGISVPVFVSCFICAFSHNFINKFRNRFLHCLCFSHKIRCF